MVSGTFDPLHLGNLRVLNEGKRLSGVQIVGVNSDQSVRHPTLVPL